MQTSAINADTRSIFPGQAIAGVANRLKFDRIRLAGGGVVAGAIAKDGAVKGGVVTIESTGVVELDNWRFATGSKYLEDGAFYYVTDDGMLTTTVGGQVAGQAISRTEMLVVLGQPTITTVTGSGSSADSVAEDLADHIADINLHHREYVGSVALTEGATTGSVTGLGLAFVPQHAFPKVSIPPGGGRLDAWAVEGTLTTDGFDFVLSGIPAAGYVLHYLLKP